MAWCWRGLVSLVDCLVEVPPSPHLPSLLFLQRASPSIPLPSPPYTHIAPPSFIPHRHFLALLRRSCDLFPSSTYLSMPFNIYECLIKLYRRLFIPRHSPLHTGPFTAIKTHDMPSHLHTQHLSSPCSILLATTHPIQPSVPVTHAHTLFPASVTLAESTITSNARKKRKRRKARGVGVKTSQP